MLVHIEQIVFYQGYSAYDSILLLISFIICIKSARLISSFLLPHEWYLGSARFPSHAC